MGVLKVKYVSCYKYLGIVIDIELSDDKDIQRQMRYQYEAVNKLRASYSRCSNAVKNVLIRSFVGPCMRNNYWCDFRKAYIPWLRAAYNFGCRALYNLPWRASVSSYQFPCNIPTFDTLLKKCVSVSWTMQRVQQRMVARFAAVRLFIPVLVLIIWTLQPYFALWLSARTLQC